VEEYYDRRAREYDDWYLGRGLFAGLDRPGWGEEVDALIRVVEELPFARTLDVACGTGFLTKHLEGDVVALDQSPRMLEEAARQAPHATVVQGDALSLPFPDTSFDRVFTAHFYGHLEGDDRQRFLEEAARVGLELVVVDSARAASDLDEEVQARVLSDGSEWTVYKRWFTGQGLAEELGGGDVLHDGHWFVAVRVPSGE
jgi:ubiquinone/menaquinone biosynthesis C-methylase UbiE